jgi:hypothetical protein
VLRSTCCLSAVVPGSNSIELPTRFVQNIPQSEICLWLGTLIVLLYFYDSRDTAVLTQLESITKTRFAQFNCIPSSFFYVQVLVIHFPLAAEIEFLIKPWRVARNSILFHSRNTWKGHRLSRAGATSVSLVGRETYLCSSPP